ncbi:hypothetical protein COO60DRAFT_704421 [Scenedesmus sp. NREL 46B-D3]|nr:hypothetical protein COO60DRAFT_704421 [Scenedesmus sp. NREL 46B-D3]
MHASNWQSVQATFIPPLVAAVSGVAAVKGHSNACKQKPGTWNTDSKRAHTAHWHTTGWFAVQVAHVHLAAAKPLQHRPSETPTHMHIKHVQVSNQGAILISNAVARMPAHQPLSGLMPQLMLQFARAR